MKTQLFFILLIGSLLITCQSQKADEQSKDTPVEKPEEVEIVTNVMDFVLPDTLEAGWTTFRYINKSEHPHFFIFELYPEGKNIDSARIKLVPPFQDGMNKIMEGKAEEAGAEFAKIPSWFSGVKFYGGSGIIAPGGTSVTTIHLDPGYYLIECYMKMKGGIFHSSAGMLEEVVVVESDTLNNEIDKVADVKIEISSEEGIAVDDTLRPGENTIEVYFKDQIVHENYAGHDVNLAEVTEEADLEELEAWMNWAVPEGLLEQPPEGVTFMGGVNNMAEGKSGYFTVDLKAGSKYVLIPEVPDAAKKNMLKTIMVVEE